MSELAFEQPQPADLPENTIYGASMSQSIRDGTLGGLQLFMARLHVDRDTRVQHDSEHQALSYDKYLSCVVDTVEALALRGLKTAVYSPLGKTEQLAGLISERRVTVGEKTRPLSVGVLGDYLQSQKANTRIIRDFNDGKLQAVVASRFFEGDNHLQADAFVITSNTTSLQRLQAALANFVPSNPAQNLIVVQLVELAAGEYGRTTYTTWDVLGEKKISQSKLIGGVFAGPEATRIATADLPKHLQPHFAALDGVNVLDAVRLSASAKALRPRAADSVPLSKIAAYFPNVPESHLKTRLEQHAGFSLDIDATEVDGEIVFVPSFSLSDALQYFSEHPIPPVADPTIQKNVDGIALQLGVSPWLVQRILEENPLIVGQTCLHPVRFREYTYYGADEQKAIAIAVANHKTAEQNAKSTTVARQAARQTYLEAEEGSITLVEAAERAGVSYGDALKGLSSEAVMRRHGKGKPALTILSEDIEQAIAKIKREILPVTRIGSVAIFSRLSHFSDRTHAKELAKFPAVLMRLPGQGPSVLTYGWDAMQHAEEAHGAPEGATSLVWELLPSDETLATPEQISYARAVQVKYMPEHRLGAAAIMSKETAQLLIEAEYRSLQPDYDRDEFAAPQTLTDNTAAIPPAEAELPPALALGAPNAAAQPINATTQEAIASSADEVTNMPPQGWVRVVDAARLLNVSFTTLRQELAGRAPEDGVAMYLIDPDRSEQGQFVDQKRIRQLVPELVRTLLTKPDVVLTKAQIAFLANCSVQEVDKRVAQLVPTQQDAESLTGSDLAMLLAALDVRVVNDQPKTKKKNRKQRAAEIAVGKMPVHAGSQRADLPQPVPAQKPLKVRTLVPGRPVSADDIAEQLGCNYRDALAAAKEASRVLGRAFKYISKHDRFGIITDHYDDPTTLGYIEDLLAGIHPHDMAKRLGVSDDEIKTFLDTLDEAPNNFERYPLAVFALAKQYFEEQK